MAMAHAPGGAVAGSLEGAVHTLLMPTVSPPVHKCLGRQNNGLAERWVHPAPLFNIFINALLRMLTATGQNQGISHGLHIGKDQDDSSQDADHGYQFNNIGFIDDISIFTETPEGMQT